MKKPPALHRSAPNHDADREIAKSVRKDRRTVSLLRIGIVSIA
jgi:hypothetical protein